MTVMQVFLVVYFPLPWCLHMLISESNICIVCRHCRFLVLVSWGRNIQCWFVGRNNHFSLAGMNYQCSLVGSNNQWWLPSCLSPTCGKLLLCLCQHSLAGLCLWGCIFIWCLRPMFCLPSLVCAMLVEPSVIGRPSQA